MPLSGRSSSSPERQKDPSTPTTELSRPTQSDLRSLEPTGTVIWSDLAGHHINRHWLRDSKFIVLAWVQILRLPQIFHALAWKDCEGSRSADLSIVGTKPVRIYRYACSTPSFRFYPHASINDLNRRSVLFRALTVITIKCARDLSSHARSRKTSAGQCKQ